MSLEEIESRQKKIARRIQLISSGVIFFLGIIIVLMGLLKDAGTRLGRYELTIGGLIIFYGIIRFFLYYRRKC